MLLNKITKLDSLGALKGISNDHWVGYFSHSNKGAKKARAEDTHLWL